MSEYEKALEREADELRRLSMASIKALNEARAERDRARQFALDLADELEAARMLLADRERDLAEYARDLANEQEAYYALRDAVD